MNEVIITEETRNQMKENIKQYEIYYKELERLNNIIEELIKGMKYIGVLKLDQIKQYENEFRTTRILGIENNDKRFAIEIEVEK